MNDQTLTTHIPRKSPLVILIFGLSIVCNQVHAEPSGGKFDKKPTGQDTPQAVLKKFIMALLDDDFESFDSCIYQGTSVSKAFYDCYQKSHVLRTALNKKYGKGAWVKFNKLELNGVVSDLSSP